MALFFTVDKTSTNLEKLPVASKSGQALSAGMSSWAEGRHGIIDRFDQSAFARYGYVQRSKGYRRKQIHFLGGIFPFTSPKNKLNKFRDTVRIPGVGHRIAVHEEGGSAVALMTVRAARGLNFVREGGRYLAEWARLHPLEQANINTRISHEMQKRMQEALDGRK